MQSKSYACICHVCYSRFTVETEFRSGSTVEFNGEILQTFSCGNHTQQEVAAAFERKPFTGYVPHVGDFATLVYPDDRAPYIVTDVSPSGKKITIEALSTNGLKPSGQCNGFPVFDHRYTPAEAKTARTGRVEAAYRQGDGSYKHGSLPIWFGEARYYRNYAD